MFIDKNTGTITFPNGLMITTELAKAGFEKSAYFDQATPYDHGTLPFQWYWLHVGQLDGHVLSARMCFYSDRLVVVEVTADFYSPNQEKWANFSYEIESQTKAFYDQLLRNQLGKPHKRVSLPLGQNQPVLDYRLEYRYKWGTVWSSYDSRAASSSIGIRYGSRLEDAQNDYRTKKEQA